MPQILLSPRPHGHPLLAQQQKAVSEGKLRIARKESEVPIKIPGSGAPLSVWKPIEPAEASEKVKEVRRQIREERLGEVLCKADPQIRIPMSCYGSFESLETDGLFAASPAGVRMAAALIKEFSKKDPEFPKKVETFVSTGLEIARGWWLGSLSS